MRLCCQVRPGGRWHVFNGAFVGGYCSMFQDEGGRLVRALFSVARDNDEWVIHLESRGGRNGSTEERNPDYAKALRLILARLAAAGFELRSAALASRSALAAGLSGADLRIRIPPFE